MSGPLRVAVIHDGSDARRGARAVVAALERAGHRARPVAVEEVVDGGADAAACDVALPQVRSAAARAAVLAVLAWRGTRHVGAVGGA